MNLSTSKILVIGLGGLGSPWLKALLSHRPLLLGLMDGDLVEDSNLSRQFIHEGRLGMNKALSAAAWLKSEAFLGEIQTLPYYLNSENTSFLENFDLILDGTDNFQAKYLIEATARKYKIPSLFASGTDRYGQVSYFSHKDHSQACLNCLYPKNEKMEDLAVCNPVTDPAPLMAIADKALSLLAKNDDELLWHYEAMTQEWNAFTKQKRADCEHVLDLPSLFHDYSWQGEKHHRLFSLEHFSEEELLKLPIHVPIVLSCQTGVRARALCIKLRALGRQNIFWKR